MLRGGWPKFNRRQLFRAGAASVAGAVVAPSLASAEPPARVKKWDHEYDVIVIGFGVAGACAATEAVKAGAKVLVLDRASAAANESHGGNIYLGGGTDLQRQLGVEDTPENMAKFLTALYRPEAGDDRIKVYSENSAAHCRWLIEQGIPFGGELYQDSWPDKPGAIGGLFYSGEEQSWPYREIAKPAQRGHKPTDSPGITSGKTLQRLLLEKTRQAGVTQLLAADAQRLALGADGAVTGVLAEVDGKVQSFRARRGVVFATGGFALNRDMMLANAPQFADCSVSDVGANNGWGQRAGKAVGAQLRHMDAGVAYFAIYPPMSRKDGLIVNSLGQRFVHEDAYYGVLGTAVVRRQGGRAFLVGDEAAMGEMASGAGGGTGSRGPVMAGKGDSIAELERVLGIPEPVLQQTLETYNRYAAKGEDPLFHKHPKHVRVLKPPFLAMLCEVGKTNTTAFTLGGLAVNSRSEVLNDDGNPIPGFYAAGKVVSGIDGTHYATTGISLGAGQYFGRIAGLNAAANKTG